MSSLELGDLTSRIEDVDVDVVIEVSRTVFETLKATWEEDGWIGDDSYDVNMWCDEAIVDRLFMTVYTVIDGRTTDSQVASLVFVPEPLDTFIKKHDDVNDVPHFNSGILTFGKEHRIFLENAYSDDSKRELLVNSPWKEFGGVSNVEKSAPQFVHGFPYEVWVQLTLPTEVHAIYLPPSDFRTLWELWPVSEWVHDRERRISLHLFRDTTGIYVAQHRYADGFNFENPIVTVCWKPIG